jgi:hypothetical protein
MKGNMSEQAEELRREIMADIERSVTEWLESAYPKWDDPFVMISKNGLYISLTEEDEFDQTLTWKEWEMSILDNDKEAIAESILLLEKLVKKLKSATAKE